MKQVLTQFPFTSLVVAGQLIFFTIFIGAILWVTRRGSAEAYKYLSDLPFEKGAGDE